MRNSQLLLLSLLISLNMFGQGFTANLSKLEISAPLTFSIDSVIYARENKEILGYIANKKTKYYSTVFPSEPVSIAIKRAFGKSKGEEKLILRINKLFVYQTLQDDSRFYNIDLNVSFISRMDNKYMERFTSAQTLKFRANYGNRYVVSTIGELLDGAFAEYQNLKKEGELRDKEIPQSEVIRKKDLTPPKKINATGKRGLYYNVYDLRDGIMDTVTQFSFEPTKTKDNEPAEGKLKLNQKSASWKDVYAFSDGNDIYLQVGRKYFQLTDSAGYFWLDFYPGYTQSESYSGGMVVSGIVGGLIGVGIYALAATFPKGHDAYYLDFERGTVVPISYLDTEKMASLTYFYGSSFLDDSDTLLVTINSSVPFKLGKNQFVVVESDYKCEPIECCIIGINENTCKTVTPILFKPQVFRCTKRRTDKYRIDNVQGSERAGIIHTIQSGEADEILVE
ncbi:hypothetical protein Oweho_0675 [Owenweeksia hongkongensis DSM 17368]|uniref:DUF4468 domain-containing protein n=1 Tax=Owenweeksia hongkongensis (strain DSM 17368 / CIP 108786 / JCM 12287 / NRRL B-23963 / UST20020801) TaxID=926562 RepID=G8R118_OWEHD|nr:hypothetical protein [Owenweeksia hongkongensis]AEV31689.1 hypothetical protein Oweho_0675 [Owenweeksia hongkongensis DSM 17368]